MAATSINLIAASDSPAPAHAPARGADKSAGDQTFADLLTGKSQQTPAGDLSTGAPARARAGTAPNAASASTKTKTPAGQSAAAISMDHAAVSATAGKKRGKTQLDRDKNSEPARTRVSQASSAAKDSTAPAAQTASGAPPSSQYQAPRADDDGDNNNDTATPPPANSDASLAALAPPTPASVLNAQQETDGSDDGETGASAPVPQSPAENLTAGGSGQAPVQDPGQAVKDTDGNGPAADGQTKSKAANPADVLSNLKTIAKAATATAQAVLAGAAQNSGSDDSAGDPTQKKADATGADPGPKTGEPKSPVKSEAKSDSDPSAAADVLASMLAANPPAPSQASPASEDDDVAPADAQNAPATGQAALSAPVAAPAPQVADQVSNQVPNPADGQQPDNSGSNPVPASAAESGDKKDQSGKAASQASGASATAPGNAISSLATAMANAQPATAAPAANNKAANPPGDAQPAAPSHDGGDKSAPGTQPQSAAAPQPGPPVQIQPAVPQQLNLPSQAAAPATASATMPGTSPGGIATSLHIATAAANAVPNLDVLAISVAARSLSGAKQFDIRLDPPELGSVQVRLSIDASGKTQAHMTADQPQTLTLLQKDAPNLAQALRDAGLNVSQNGLNFSLRGQSRQDDARNGGAPSRRIGLSATAAAAPAPQLFSRAGAASQARVDIHV